LPLFIVIIHSISLFPFLFSLFFSFLLSFSFLLFFFPHSFLLSFTFLFSHSHHSLIAFFSLLYWWWFPLISCSKTSKFAWSHAFSSLSHQGKRTPHAEWNLLQELKWSSQPNLLTFSLEILQLELIAVKYCVVLNNYCFRNKKKKANIECEIKFVVNIANCLRINFVPK